ncbi:MAG: hypothetical protein AB7F78_05225 [Hyphomicrobiaceae bacterium]
MLDAIATETLKPIKSTDLDATACERKKPLVDDETITVTETVAKEVATVVPGKITQ